MTGAEKRPSEIRFSQQSISSRFSCGRNIGATLDDIMDDRTELEDIPTIRVTKTKRRIIITHDNRRLWVFKHLERLKKCEYIPVEVDQDVKSFKDKMTTTTDGESVKVRGCIEGEWFKRFPDGSDGYDSTEEGTMETVSRKRRTNMASFKTTPRKCRKHTERHDY